VRARAQANTPLMMRHPRTVTHIMKSSTAILRRLGLMGANSSLQPNRLASN
jgi:hypothetical protein